MCSSVIFITGAINSSNGPSKNWRGQPGKGCKKVPIAILFNREPHLLKHENLL